MSLIKKKKKSRKSSKRPGKNILTTDYTGRQVQAKVVITKGYFIETPSLIEYVPNYTKCNICEIFLGEKEVDLADVLGYNCIECFEMQIEGEYSVNTVLVSPISVASRSKGRKK